MSLNTGYFFAKTLPVISMRRHMLLVEGLFLVEHNLVNPAAIDTYIHSLATRCKPDAGKTWLQKKLRSLIMNDTQYLTALSADDLSLMRGLPDYITQAAERGDAIFSFEPKAGAAASALATLIQAMNHVVDWFNALAVVAARQTQTQIAIEDKAVAEKWLEKLPKIPIGEINVIADTWFAKMGSRIAAEKHGVETIQHWPNGFYAVRYTDLATMKSDGRDLQNCLQSGTYWDHVKKGIGAVYGIRKPNDEAVVGIRALLRRNGHPSLEECKGKNNKPVAPGYVPYVVDFLTHMGFQIEDNHDLKAAGIEVHDGKLGTFESIAAVTYDQDGIKLWQTRARFVATTPDGRIDGHLTNQRISAIDQLDRAGDAVEQLPSLLTVLNILQLPPVGPFLTKRGIFYHDGRYGDARTVGKHVFAVGGYTGYQVSMTTAAQEAYSQIMVFVGDEAATVPVGRLVVDANQHLTLFNGPFTGQRRQPDDPAGAPDAIFLGILNALGLPPSFELEPSLQVYGIYFNKVKYGSLAALGTVDITVGPVHIHRLGKRPVWLMQHSTKRDAMRLWLIGKRLRHDSYPDWMGYRDSRLSAQDAIRQLALKYKVKTVDSAEDFGMVNTDMGLVADFPSFLAVASKTPDLAYTNVYAKHGDAPLNNQRLFTAAQDMFPGKLDHAQQQAIYTVTKPDDAGMRADISETDTIYDIQVPHITLILASAGLMLINQQVLTDKAVIALIRKDVARAIKQAARFVSGLTYANVSVRGTPGDGANLVAYQALVNQIEVLNTATEAAIHLRRINPDKYATDLSSRFAAMNAFRRY